MVIADSPPYKDTIVKDIVNTYKKMRTISLKILETLIFIIN